MGRGAGRRDDRRFPLTKQRCRSRCALSLPRLGVVERGVYWTSWPKPINRAGAGHKEPTFAELFEASLEQRDKVKEGEIVRGTVVHVAKDYVVVDIGYKSEGRVSLDEFRDTSGEIAVQGGDGVDVLIERMEDDDGLIVLSKEKADKMKVWDEISAACERDELIEGTIASRVKGGLSVAIRGGVKAFLPGSQVDLRPIRNLDPHDRADLPVQGHQVQQEARQHRAVPPRPARAGAR